MRDLLEKFFPIECGLKDIGICSFCKKPIDKNEFKDVLSLKEHRQSGLCMKCQDEFFKD